MCDKTCISRKEKQVLWAILLEVKSRVKALEKHAFFCRGGKRPTGAALSECAEMDKPFSTHPTGENSEEPSSILSPEGRNEVEKGSGATLTKYEWRQS